MKKEFVAIQKLQRKIQALVWKKFKNYYLTGGTALAFHFKHRFSEDLDFFTQSYDPKTPDQIMEYLKKETGFSYKFKTENTDPRFVQMKVFTLSLPKNFPLKIDFVRDAFTLSHPPKKGIDSIENIYFRKCSIATRTFGKIDILGQEIPGGRQTAKDLFDLYFLSKHAKPLNQFCFDHFTDQELERLCLWYRRFNRLNLKIDLQELITDEDISQVLPHLDQEILTHILKRIREP